jgi:hypothetical protein
MLPNVLVELLGRSSGPFHARLFVQPIVAVVLAIRAGLRDAHSANPAFLWGIVTGSTADRRQLIRSAWQDLGKMFVVGVAIDLVRSRRSSWSSRWPSCRTRWYAVSRTA